MNASTREAALALAAAGVHEAPRPGLLSGGDAAADEAQPTHPTAEAGRPEAARLSDVVVITSDNPRSEDPLAIIDEIRRGIPAGEAASDRTPDVTAIVDRAAAIEKAVAMARPGDVVLIAGKGHEKTQHVGDRVLAFDDADVSRAALARRHARAG